MKTTLTDFKLDVCFYSSPSINTANIFCFKKRKTHAEYDTSFIKVKILDKRG